MNRTPTKQSLIPELLDSFEKHADRTALVVEGGRISYEDLGKRAAAVANELRRQNQNCIPCVGILATRSEAAYIGILGTMWAGSAYLPLNPRFPTERLCYMLQAASCTQIVVGEECAATLAAIAPAAGELTVLCPNFGPALRILASKHPSLRFIETATDTLSVSRDSARSVNHAYLMFTSGTTGAPKGIAITHANLRAYLSVAMERYQMRSEDRVSQMFDLTFDLSVHDIFVSFLSGAALYVVPPEHLMAPGKFIKHHELTRWFSVPSVPMLMARMRMLKADSFPSLRYSLFCGEALPQRIAEMWQAAAPNSTVENLYGPTETTIAITGYRWNPDTSPSECVNGIVPIGVPFEGAQVRVLKASGEPASHEEPGELYLAGPQVAPGYLNDEERTRQRFVHLSDTSNTLWYRTGDVVRTNQAGLCYLGRTDDQVQVRGFRVELQEIDHVIRRAVGNDLAIVVPTDFHDGRAASVVAYVQGTEDQAVTSQVFEECKRVLPDYMIPAEVRFLAALPLNSNGKIDRKALMEVNR